MAVPAAAEWFGLAEGVSLACGWRLLFPVRLEAGGFGWDSNGRFPAAGAESGHQLARSARRPEALCLRAGTPPPLFPVGWGLMGDFVVNEAAGAVEMMIAASEAWE